MTERTQISGSVERITYYNAENGYSVVRIKPDDRGMLPFKYASGRDSLVTAVGTMPELSPGEWVKLTGQWLNHPKHGRQLQVELCEQALPASAEGVKRYLGSGLIRGVGPKTAERIVAQFGADTLDVIDHEPERLYEVNGIGKKRVAGIIEAWNEQRAIKDVMIFLQGHGISTHLAVKIYKEYGDAALGVVQNTPYQMVRDIHGIGFKTADKIAQAMGLAADDPARIEAGIAYTLNRMASEGHVYMPQEDLEPDAAEILGLTVAQISAVIDALDSHDLIQRETIRWPEPAATEPVASGRVAESGPTYASGTGVREERAVYLTPMYFSEIGVTRRVQQLVNAPFSQLADCRWTAVERQKSISLSAAQQQAVQTALANKDTIRTGGPGTGKTTTLRALLDLLDHYGKATLLASPTGRAAKRLTEATGREAKTIHRLLEFNPGEGFGRDEEKPLDADMVVIDEASMLDLVLANNLLKAIAPGTHLLLVGDIDQLPSVGAGDVLSDLIDSGITAVVRLHTIFRQAQDSLIIHNAHRINQGLMPETRADATDFFIFVKDDPAETAELLVDIVQKRVPHKFGFDPVDDIQVLAPMYNGQVGVNSLNEALQAALNPRGRKPEVKLGGRAFRVGDKVMQLVNNYDKSVFNGDIGRVMAIDSLNQTLTVSIDGEPVVYDFLEADELTHAYAISVHKSQGAEYPCVVIPTVMQHYMMLQRNLLYTAVTRAKRLAILVGTRKAIYVAVNNDKLTDRHTALDWRLQQR